MADINKRLLTAKTVSGDVPAPQHKVKGESDFEFTEGSGGAQHTKIVDSSGQPISIDEELKSIKRTQAEILDRLDKGIDTRQTGSNVELIKNHEDTHMADYDKGTVQFMYFGNNEINAPSPLEALDVSGFSDISIYLENNYNDVLGSIYVYGMKEKDSIGRDGNLIYSFKVDDLEEGESIYITKEDFQDLKKPVAGLGFRYRGDTKKITQGFCQMIVYGKRR